FVFDSQTSFVVYTAEQDQSGLDELYRVDLDNPGTATKLNAPLVANGDVDYFKLTADDSRVAYIAAQEDPSVWELFEVKLAEPGIATKMSAPMAESGVYWFDYAEGDSHLV